jgi:hypothetical protein
MTHGPLSSPVQQTARGTAHLDPAHEDATIRSAALGLAKFRHVFRFCGSHATRGSPPNSWLRQAAEWQLLHGLILLRRAEQLEQSRGGIPHGTKRSQSVPKVSERLICTIFAYHPVIVCQESFSKRRPRFHLNLRNGQPLAEMGNVAVGARPRSRTYSKNGMRRS